MIGGRPKWGTRAYLVPAGAGVKVDVVEFEVLHAEWALLGLVVGVRVENGHLADRIFRLREELGLGNTTNLRRPNNFAQNERNTKGRIFFWLDRSGDS